MIVTAANRESESDIQLIQRSQRGDKQAFHKLYNRHYKQIYGICKSVLVNPEDAADVASQSWINAYNNLHQFYHGDFIAWMRRIIHNAAMDLYRITNKHPTVSIDFVWNSAGDDTGNPVSQCLNKEDRERIAEAISTLPDKMRLPVVLFYLESKSMEEIAEIMGCPLGTVGSRLNSARNKLREWLEDLVEHESPARQRGSSGNSPYLFRVCNISKPLKMAETLMRTPRIRVYQHVWMQFPPDVQVCLESRDKTRYTVACALAAGLNAVLHSNKPLYSRDLFDGVELPEKVKKLVCKQPLGGKDRIRLNRILLENLFPGHFNKKVTPKSEAIL